MKPYSLNYTCTLLPKPNEIPNVMLSLKVKLILSKYWWETIADLIMGGNFSTFSQKVHVGTVKLLSSWLLIVVIHSLLIQSCLSTEIPLISMRCKLQNSFSFFVLSF